MAPAYGAKLTASGFSELRARRALKDAGLDANVALQPASSVTNEVWLSADHAIRVNRQPDQRLLRESGLSHFLPEGVGYPFVVAHGGDLGADWLVVERLPGQPLSRCWPHLSDDERRRAVSELADRLRLVHATPCPRLRNLNQVPQLLDPGPDGMTATARLRGALSEAGRLAYVNPSLTDELLSMVTLTADAIEPFHASTLVHGDLTFENVLWDGEHVCALLDFEWARPGPPDLDLDVFLRFSAFPQHHVAADYEAQTRPEDYTDLPWWLAESYPELFRHPRAFERTRIYSIAWDVQELLSFPPPGPARDLHEHHPYRRLCRTVDGTSHLDVLNGTSVRV